MNLRYLNLFMIRAVSQRYAKHAVREQSAKTYNFVYKYNMDNADC